MTKEEIYELKKSHFHVISLDVLNGRYLINNACTIIDTYKDLNDCIIYTWNPLTAMNPIEINLVNGESQKMTPARLHLITYYGYFEADIYDMGCGVPSGRYRYIINVEEKLSNDTLVLNNDIFKYSKLYDVYINQYGCAYREFSILKHLVTNKEYHSITGNNKRCMIHRAIYDAWIGIEDINNDIHHIDGRGWNNYYKNLQEIDPEEHRKIWRGTYIYTDEVVYKVCELMSQGMRPYEAAKQVGIPGQAALRYRNGCRPEISSKFTYPKLEGFKLSRLTNDQVREICGLFENTKLTNKEISEIYNVDKDTIQDIRRRITWRNISKDYSFETQVSIPNAKYNSLRNASITEDDAIRVYKLLKEGHQICTVRDMTGISYEIVKKIKYKTSWASVTDKLDAELENQHNEGSTTIESIAQEKSLGEISE